MFFWITNWKLLVGLVLLLLPGFPVWGQQAWTLADCLDFSRKNNLAVRKEEYEKGKYQLQVQAARKRFVPVIDTRWKTVSNWGFLIDPTTNELDRKFNFGNQVSLNANLDLVNGAASGLRSRVYTHQLRAAEYQYEAAVNNAALEIIYLYLQALLSQEQERLAGQRIRQLETQQKQIRQQLARGVLSKRDLLNLQSLLATEEYNAVVAANHSQKARFILMQTMGLQQDSLIRIAPVPASDSLMTPPAPPLLTAREENFPEVKAGQARIAAAQAQVHFLRSQKYPVLSLASQVGSRTSSSREAEFNLQLKNNMNQQIGLHFTIPILSKPEVQASIDMAQLELESAKLAQRQKQQEVRQRILLAAQDYKAAHRKYNAARLSLAALKEEFRFADRQLGLGLINALAFGEVRSRYMAAESEWLQNKYECLFKLKILHYFQGLPLY